MATAAALVLVPVAGIGAALSFESLYRAAVPVFGERLALGFPFLVDLLILGASLRFVAGAKVGQHRAGWRLTAHAGVAGTLVLNALAARTTAQVPWHVTAPAVWSVLVELTARDVLGTWRAAHAAPRDKIPLRLWLTTPAESFRVSWRMARTGCPDAATVREITERCATARDQLTAVLPGPRNRRIRRQITRRLASGVLDPAVLSDLIETIPDPSTLHRTVLRAIATGTTPGSLPGTGPDTAPGTRPDTVPGTTTDTVPDTTSGSVPGARADVTAGAAPGRTRSARPARAGAARSSAGRATAADKVARIARQYPDATPAELARRARLSERTVRRYLPKPSDQPHPGEADGDEEAAA